MGNGNGNGGMEELGFISEGLICNVGVDRMFGDWAGVSSLL